MTALGKRLIASMKEVNAVMGGEESPEDWRVTPSCGCIFCDLSLDRFKMKRQHIHYVRREGRIIVCTRKD